jgi:glycosidase
MAEYPRLNMVGEEWSSNPNVVSHWQRGKVNFDGYVSHMSGMIDFPVHEALRRALGDEKGSLTSLYEMLALDYLYPEPRKLMLFEGNHDVPRLYSVLNEDENLSRMALVFLLTAPRIPQLYYGTEILMTSPKERDDAAARLDFPGGWAGDKVNAFTGAGLSGAQKSAQAFLMKLMNWRKTQSVIHEGKFLHFAPEDGTYVYFRYNDQKKLMVILNHNKKATRLATARFAEMLAGANTGIDALSGATVSLKESIQLPARSATILELAP